MINYERLVDDIENITTMIKESVQQSPPPHHSNENCVYIIGNSKPEFAFFFLVADHKQALRKILESMRLQYNDLKEKGQDMSEIGDMFEIIAKLASKLNDMSDPFIESMERNSMKHDDGFFRVDIEAEAKC